MENPDLPDGSANKGQTGAHRIPTAEDPMKDMKICVGGKPYFITHFTYIYIRLF